MVHVLVSNLINVNKIHHKGMAGWVDAAVELPVQTIAAEFGKRFKPAAIDRSLLSYVEYGTGKCRAFTASEALVDAVVQLPNDTDLNMPAVNLFDGQPYRVQARSHWQGSGFAPAIISRAVENFGAHQNGPIYAHQK